MSRVIVDPCVLTSPCWLAEHLDEAGVAETDWTREIPVPVIEVVEAMYARLDRDEYPTEDALAAIADHFAAARRAHREAVERNRLVPPDGWDDEYGPLPEDPSPPLPGSPVVPLGGGRWEPTPDAVAAILEARGRRLRRAVTRPLARRRIPEAQPGLWDIPVQRTGT